MYMRIINNNDSSNDNVCNGPSPNQGEDVLARLEQVPVYGRQNRLEEGSLASDAFKAQNAGQTRQPLGWELWRSLFFYFL